MSKHLPMLRSERIRCAGCIGCYYLGQVGEYLCCDYLIRTGHRRGCPSGKDCERKIIGEHGKNAMTVSNRKKVPTAAEKAAAAHARLDAKYKATYNIAKIRKLYREGYGRRAIADKVGGKQATLRNVIAFYGWDVKYAEEHNRNLNKKTRSVIDDDGL